MAAHRVVRICKVDEPGLLPRGETEQRRRVFAVLHIGCGDEPAAKAITKTFRKNLVVIVVKNG